MKKKIFILVGLFAMIAVAGGAYLFYTIKYSEDRLDELIQLHQREMRRVQLLLHLNRVQNDLLSVDTERRESAAALKHVNDLETTSSRCFDCHHTEVHQKGMMEVHRQISQYIQQSRKIFAPGELTGEWRRELEKARKTGDLLIATVNAHIESSGMMLNERTEAVEKKVHRLINVVVMLIFAGPLTILVFGYATHKSFNKPIQTLLSAVRRMKTGDMDVSVEGRNDEFTELTLTFNEMASVLRNRMREIADNERRYRLLFESSGDAIFILDAEGEKTGNIVATNRSAAIMHGYSVEELTRLNIFKDLETPFAASSAQGRQERLERGEWVKDEIEHLKKDGTAFPVELNAGVFEFDGHRYILSSMRDITERRRTAEALQRAEQLKMTGELTTGLAHEIKNPLASIRLSMETLVQEPYLKDDDRNVLFEVVAEIKRIDDLIKGILSFARPPKPYLMPTDLNVVLDSAAQLVTKNRPSRKDGGSIELVKDFATNLPEIIADPAQLRQVFMNLLMNAIEAMNGQGTVVLKTSFDVKNAAVVAAVSDTGKGIDPADLKRLFQPFFTTKVSGTGLGLAISKRLIEEQGGHISIESREGSGATFFVTLPCDHGKDAASHEG